MSAVDLTTRYLGLELRAPIVASPSPLTGHLDTLKQLDIAGVGAVVLPSLFEEQLEHDSFAIDRMLGTGAEMSAEASSFFPDLEDYNTGPVRYLELVERAKAELSVPVIASLNGNTPGGWVHYARLLERAGADAIELNVYAVAADPMVTGAQVEEDIAELVREVRRSVEVPVAVKLPPYFSAMANFARHLAVAGADGLVLFNRFYQPDLDLETLLPHPTLVLSTSDELRVPLRWIGILRHRVGVSLAATTGVHTAEDALKVLLAGADVAMTTSALLRHGPGHAAELISGIAAWMVEHEYTSITQLKGSAAQERVADPVAYERANYVQTLASWSSDHTL